MPEGWAWASLSEIANIYTGNSINENEKANKYSNLKEGLFYIATKDIDFEGKINYNNGIRIPLAESKFKIAPAESTLLCIEGGSAGRKIGFINQDVCFVNKLCCFHSDQLSNLYLFYYLQSRTFIDLFNANKSGLIGGVSLNLLKSIFIPVAPTIEQDLISKTIATYLEKITSLNKDKETLELTIKKTKSKILDLAIHGKLVPQDSNDEPASVLLEKLRAEKEEKIAKGELKRDKNDSYIYKGSDNCYYKKFVDGSETDISDEIPFEIPDNWNWCNLGEIYSHTTGKALKKENNKGTLRKYITTSNLYWNCFDFTDVRTMYFTDDELEKCTIKKGDLVLCNGGDVGRAAIWKSEEDICYQNHVSRLRPKLSGINNSFYLYVIQINKEKGNLSGKGVGITSLSATDILNLKIPLPPLAEQKRIVEKIENAFAKLDQIAEQLA